MTAGQQETLKHLLAEILSDPASDANRLVYADACDEFGDPDRGDFIRVQCELAKPVHILKEDLLGEQFPGQAILAAQERVGFPALRRRERELLGLTPVRGGMTNYVLWFDGAPKDAWASNWDWAWRRGFVESVRCACEAWLAHGPQVVACQPVLTLQFRPPLTAGSLPREWLPYAPEVADFSGPSYWGDVALSWAKAEARRKELTK